MVVNIETRHTRLGMIGNARKVCCLRSDIDTMRTLASVTNEVNFGKF